MEEFTWAHLLPLRHVEGRGLVDFSHFDPTAVAYSLLVSAILLAMGLAFRARFRPDPLPEGRMSLRALFELVLDGVLYFSRDIIGPGSERFVALTGTLALFILFGNLLGLLPGFVPPTSNINVNFGCAIVVFVCYHWWGVRRHGLSYLKHFVGPIWWLCPLYMPIEVISHLARVLSLSVRLFGNMTGDHLVLTMFSSLVPLLVPVFTLVLGTFVSFIQTLIFVGLSMMYISLAIEESHR